MDWVELGEKPKLITVTRVLLSLLRNYFRIEVVGLEHLPKKGRAIIAPNHSGFAGFDAALLAFVIKRETRRRPRILAHRAYFQVSKKLKEVSESFGLRQASFANGVDTLKKDNLLMIFPEGESGNFKPTKRAYLLQRFHTGFIRMAIQGESPVIPCVILGAEETHLSLGNIDLTRWVKGLRIPLPLNFLPLPARWKIVFMPPVPADHWKTEWLEDAHMLRKAALMVQRQVQREIRVQLKARTYIYSPQTRKAYEWAKGWVSGAFKKK